MNIREIISKKQLAEKIVRMEVYYPEIAQKAHAGQFVVLIPEESSERIPLTLADWDQKKGTITLIFQEVGYTTARLAVLEVGSSLFHLAGPWGKATAVDKIGRVICVGGGVGIAEVYPVSRAFKEAGNRVVGILGSRSQSLLILENEMRGVCDELYVTTDDGSYGKKGFVTDVLKGIFMDSLGEKPDLLYAIGPVVMMEQVARLTRERGIKTLVSLNPIMVDATGMCGSCRVRVGEKTCFACVDGPEFDAHQVDFAELKRRLNLFKEKEAQIYQKAKE